MMGIAIRMIVAGSELCPHQVPQISIKPRLLKRSLLTVVATEMRFETKHEVWQPRFKEFEEIFIY